MKRLLCAVLGHDFEWTRTPILGFKTHRCRRCGGRCKVYVERRGDPTWN